MGLYFGEIEAFPSNTTILVKLSAADGSETSNHYETEIAKDENLLASLLRRLHISFEPSKPCTEFKKYAIQIMRRHIGSFYCEEDNIKRLLTKLRIDLTPSSEFPDGGTEPEAGRIPKRSDADIVSAKNINTENPISNKKDTRPYTDDTYDTVMSESIILDEDKILNNKIIPEGSEVIFWYKGSLKE
jgi:hypothetical protein